MHYAVSMPDVKRTRADRAAASRAAVVAAASELFAERGYEGVRVQDVAARAGATTGTIYAHFRGREELLAAAVEAHVGEVLLTVLGPDVNDVASLVASLGPHLAEDPDSVVSPLGLEALIALRRDPGLVEAVGPRVASVADRLADLPGGAVDGRATAYAMYALALGAALLAPISGIRPEPDAWAQLVDRVSEAFRAP
jgi:AcrR family transcriptional regulator